MNPERLSIPNREQQEKIIQEIVRELIELIINKNFEKFEFEKIKGDNRYRLFVLRIGDNHYLLPLRIVGCKNSKVIISFMYPTEFLSDPQYQYPQYQLDESELKEYSSEINRGASLRKIPINCFIGYLESYNAYSNEIVPTEYKRDFCREIFLNPEEARIFSSTPEEGDKIFQNFSQLVKKLVEEEKLEKIELPDQEFFENIKKLPVDAEVNILIRDSQSPNYTSYILGTISENNLEGKYLKLKLKDDGREIIIYHDKVLFVHVNTEKSSLRLKISHYNIMKHLTEKPYLLNPDEFNKITFVEN